MLKVISYNLKSYKKVTDNSNTYSPKNSSFSPFSNNKK